MNYDDPKSFPKTRNTYTEPIKELSHFLYKLKKERHQTIKESPKIIASTSTSSAKEIKRKHKFILLGVLG